MPDLFESTESLAEEAYFIWDLVVSCERFNESAEGAIQLEVAPSRMNVNKCGVL